MRKRSRPRSTARSPFARPRDRSGNGGGTTIRRTARSWKRFRYFPFTSTPWDPWPCFALGEAIQSDFSPWIYKGLEWIDDNELGINMKDDSANVVWRCIGRTKPYRYWNLAANFLTGREDRESRNGLIVLHECRPVRTRLASLCVCRLGTRIIRTAHLRPRLNP